MGGDAADGPSGLDVGQGPEVGEYVSIRMEIWGCGVKEAPTKRSWSVYLKAGRAEKPLKVSKSMKAVAGSKSNDRFAREVGLENSTMNLPGTNSEPKAGRKRPDCHMRVQQPPVRCSI